MCGIFTAIYKNKDKLNLDFCNSSIDQLKKRGPDWSFSKTIGKIFFGQTVLSMSGKKQKSIQDHISNSQRFMILFNGEIYNFRFLREKYGSLIPSEILNRPKTGFGIPVAEWLRGPLYTMSRDILLSAKARNRNYFNIKSISNILSQHKSKSKDHSNLIWSLIMLELWFNKYIDGN